MEALTEAITTMMIPLLMLGAISFTIILVFYILTKAKKKEFEVENPNSILKDKAFNTLDRSAKVVYLWTTTMTFVVAVVMVSFGIVMSLNNSAGNADEKASVTVAIPDETYKPPTKKEVVAVNEGSQDVKKSKKANKEATQDTNKALKEADQLFKVKQ